MTLDIIFKGSKISNGVFFAVFRYFSYIGDIFDITRLLNLKNYAESLCQTLFLTTGSLFHDDFRKSEKSDVKYPLKLAEAKFHDLEGLPKLIE